MNTRTLSLICNVLTQLLFIIAKYVVSAKKTASGNYVVETKGAGYGIKGGDDYHPASGKYIEIRICLTPEGKILDVITTFQEESKGIGDACANEKFYGQFDGKTEENYKKILRKNSLFDLHSGKIMLYYM